MTLGFLFGVPFVVGVLTMLLARGYCSNPLIAGTLPLVSSILYIAVLGCRVEALFASVWLALVLFMSSLVGC